jgi:vacuolar-type H+-ATPase subunit I/STV1
MDANCHPSRPRRLKRPVKGPSDGPPGLSRVDKIIKHHHGSSTAIEATRQQLQESKQYPIPSLQERIEQLQKQNSSLKHEIAYYREIEPYREEFYNRVTQIEEDLRKALSNLGRIQQQVGYGWAQLRQGSRADIQKDSNSSEV